jgi:hypothetical protein
MPRRSDKDRDWLRAAIDAGIAPLAEIDRLVRGVLPPAAPDLAERLRRVDSLRGI